MANYGPSSAWLLVGGRNLSPDTGTLTDEVEQIEEETHTFGDTWEEHKPVGIARVTLEASGGLYDDAAGAINEALQAKSGTVQSVAYGFQGLTIGKACVLLFGALASIWKRVASGSGLTKANGTYRVTGNHKEAVILNTLTPRTADGHTKLSSVDLIPSGVVSTSSKASPSVITCAAPHHLKTGQDVYIAGHTSTPDINGRHRVTVIDATTFSIAVNVTVAGTGGTYVTNNILTSSIANPTLITTGVQHGLQTGDYVVIVGHTSVTPALDGIYQVTVLSETTFTIPLNVSADGVGGTFYKSTGAGTATADLHVTALTLGGYTNVAINVIHSDDDSSYGTLMSFTAVVLPNVTERKTTVTAVKRYVAVEWDFTGSGSGATISPFVAISR